MLRLLAKKQEFLGRARARQPGHGDGIQKEEPPRGHHGAPGGELPGAVHGSRSLRSTAVPRPSSRTPAVHSHRHGNLIQKEESAGVHRQSLGAPSYVRKLRRAPLSRSPGGFSFCIQSPCLHLHLHRRSPGARPLHGDRVTVTRARQPWGPATVHGAR